MSGLGYLDLAGERIAYRLREGGSPAILFLPGYASDMEGTKATAIDELAGRRGVAMLRFDYSGTGSSGGRFEDGTLSAWLDQALAALDLLERPANSGRLELPNPYGPQPQLFTRAFWQSGQDLRLLGDEIGVGCPVRLLHGEVDGEVPLEVAFRLMRRIRSSDVQLNVLKGGGHRLSEPHEIRTILGTVGALLEPGP